MNTLYHVIILVETVLRFVRSFTRITGKGFPPFGWVFLVETKLFSTVFRKLNHDYR